MIVFLTSILAATLVSVIVALLVFHHKATTNWAEERAFLMNAVVAKNSGELRSMYVPGPETPVKTRETHWTEELEGYESPVGM